MTTKLSRCHLTNSESFCLQTRVRNQDQRPRKLQVARGLQSFSKRDLHYVPACSPGRTQSVGLWRRKLSSGPRAERAKQPPCNLEGPEDLLAPQKSSICRAAPVWGWLFGRAKLGGLPSGMGWRWWQRTWEGRVQRVRVSVQTIEEGVWGLVWRPRCLGCRLCEELEAPHPGVDFRDWARRPWVLASRLRLIGG